MKNIVGMMFMDEAIIKYMEDTYNFRSEKAVSPIRAQMIYTSTNTPGRETP